MTSMIHIITWARANFTNYMLCNSNAIWNLILHIFFTNSIIYFLKATSFWCSSNIGDTEAAVTPNKYWRRALIILLLHSGSVVIVDPKNQLNELCFPRDKEAVTRRCYVKKVLKTWRPEVLLKSDFNHGHTSILQHRCFPVNFAKFSRTPIS